MRGQSNDERPHRGLTTATSPTVDDQMMCIQWPLVVFGACFAAIGAALQALQTKGRFPMSSQLVYVALVISLAPVIVSVYSRSNYKRASVLVVHIRSLIGATALMVALDINLQLPLMAKTIAVYLIAIAVNRLLQLPPA